jgi:quercetin dioxygenase-like cupin family protein
MGAIGLAGMMAFCRISAALAPAAIEGRIVLENERVLVKAITLGPGQSTGAHGHPGPALWVFVRGGVLKSESTGRATLWRDGRVRWVDPSTVPDDALTNAGAAPIEIREVVLKPAPAAGASASDFGYLSYPKIPLEDLFENDRVIVQRFVMRPGEWEGVHAHHPNTLYVYIKGGRYVSRTRNPPTRELGDTPDGYVGWMPAIDLKAGHESGNIGATPSDVVWIALKP